MAQSLVNNYLHIIFSTKHRQPLIQSPYDNDLYNYIGGICRDMESNPIRVGGHLDHVHILCMLSKKVALSDLIKGIKTRSSKWAKTHSGEFYWQEGYGAFSVNPTQIDKVVEYINSQHEHHRVKTFQDEYRGFLKKYNVEYDERYVWD
ncbi:transposase [Flavipsychrobacter stenotrophus]|uniref:Transposase n=1 Tax=Flavipsychrobacter stenotrophus TaxID=2077091 RepID=A0A2S7SVH3_9BACT|nr:IS200/IS605 family transposase [Flavipsychrobacter stenotrophus]PQJ10605.1 transposase [Flavipsychrobacter stenotrophus]